MSTDTPIIYQQYDDRLRENARLREELAEAVNQIKLAQKGYDYMGACEDARHYKELAEKYKAELAAKLEDAKRLQFLVDKPEFQIEYTGELTLREHIDAAIKEGK